MDLERICANPFYVLGLRPGCGRAAVEHEGRRLIQMIEMAMEGAGVYSTPLGERSRTVDDVRHAMDELRDPARRAQHEPWATLPSSPLPPVAPHRRDPWPDAHHLFGW